ncbi:MAG TPA: hemerythrin domain-containing protein [Candidatus Acidoferrum sp.]|nr:hemerythrin domain-containing protein [Candidatus Acidoferrum sp.]
MTKCIETMMEEHELIVQVLASLQAMARQLETGAQVPRQDVADFAQFFRQFADKCHHGKEEDQLFRTMVEFGFPQQSGPIAVMLSEHDAGRDEVRSLVEIGAGSGPMGPPERARILGAASQFVPLLFSHIQKENNILYPMAQQAIPPSALQELDRSCAAFDREVLGQAEVRRLKTLAADLVSRYPASPRELAGYSVCGACTSAA